MMKEIEIIKDFFDLKNKNKLRKTGEIIKVTETRAKDLVSKGFAKTTEKE